MAKNFPHCIRVRASDPGYAPAGLFLPALRRAVASKIASYYSLVEREKKSNAEYRAVQPRIQKFFQDKP
jgi:hypothetical protein